MKLLQKLKKKSGVTLVEVLVVVALMMIMLGLAVPNLLAESQEIKMATLNGNARAVAVAVQSRLYGMKNKGTVSGSEFANLLKKNTTTVQVQTENGPEEVKVLANFGSAEEETEEEKAGKSLLSGALTDVELLNKGKIVVVYSPVTADVLEVFYSEKEFPIMEDGSPNVSLFPMANKDYLIQQKIGAYLGDPKPEYSRKNGLPPFTVVWRYDDELYLELQMVGTPSKAVSGKNIGIEVYAVIPEKPGSYKTEEVLIYAEGMFASKFNLSYEMKKADGTTSETGTSEINEDYNLTIDTIASNKVEEEVGETKTERWGILRFAFDSLVTTRANYGAATQYLRHQSSPDFTTMASGLLYPRESIANWFNLKVNPYLSYWALKNDIKAEEGNIYDRIQKGAGATQFIDVDDTIRLHIKMYVLSDEQEQIEKPDGTYIGSVYKRDEDFGVLDLLSHNISPYYNGLSTAQNKVTLSSVRDLNNLPYVFETENEIDTAELSGDITAQALYDKIVKVHNALKDKVGEDKLNWSYGADFDTTTVDINYFKNKKNFTLSGTKPKSLGGGSYKIVSVAFAGQSPQPGGLFAYAENCTFKDLDIVNPKVWRNNYSRTVLGESVDKLIPSVDKLIPSVDKLIPSVGWGNVASGALAAVAVNCTFTNVRAYIDPALTLKATSDGEEFGNASITYYRVTGGVVGGLVGVAIGNSTVQTYYDGKNWVDEGSSETTSATTFTNCVASTLLCPEYYYNAGDCFVAGGLVGVSVGDVQIKNSYASSQLTGYYAGGLVGAVGSADVKDSNQHNWQFASNFPNGGKFKGGAAEGNLQIENSFAAGVIQHTVRVGGGLIAHISKNKTGSKKASVSVSDCYSAVNWQIVPPVAYGTFEGDTENYYLYPTKFDLPVTANVVARFSCEKETDGSKSYTGNVFSLQDGVKCGVACSSKTLIKKLSKTETEPGTEPALKDGWVDKTKTTTEKTWSHLETKATASDTTKTGDYPFPMPKDNTEFWGTWTKSYDTFATSDDEILTKDSTTDPNGFGFTFDGYYVAYQTNEWKMYAKCIDTGTVTTVNRKIDLSGETIKIGDSTLDKDGATLKDTKNKESYSWAENAMNDKGELYCGQGVDNGNVYGATKISKGDDENTISFASAKYYSKDYDALKGSSFTPEGDGIKYGGTKLMWDYYGFYLLPEFDPNSGSNHKYYIITGDVTSGQATKGTDHFNTTTNEGGEVWSNMSYANITVNKTQFENAIGYRTITLSMENAEITWSEGEGLHVKPYEKKNG